MAKHKEEKTNVVRILEAAGIPCTAYEVPLEKGQLTGVVTSVTFMGVHYEIIVDVGGFKWMIQTTDFVDVDEQIGIELEPDAIHIMKKSEYSDLYGDYSSFSNELDELSEVSEEEDE